MDLWHVGELYSLHENVTAACGICTALGSCGGKGVGASSILVSSIATDISRLSYTNFISQFNV